MPKQTHLLRLNQSAGALFVINNFTDEIAVSFSCITNEGKLLFTKTCLTFRFMPLHAKHLNASMSN